MAIHGLPLARLSGALSCFGSMWILVEILFNSKKRSTCHHRILWGLSFFDLLSSFWFFIGDWGQPSGFHFFSNRVGYGNDVTCQISGFFIYLGGLTIPPYNAALSWYYYLVICSRWNENRIKKNFERYVHFLIGPVALIVATVPIFMDVYGPYYFYCFATTYVFQLLYWISVFCNSFASLIAMINIVVRVRRTLRRSDAYDFRHESSNGSHAWHSIRSLFTRESLRSRNATSRRTRRRKRIASTVSTTAILYTIPFLFTWFVPMVWYCFVYSDFRSIHNNKTIILALTNPMELYLTTVLPLQGFLNFLVYKRVIVKRLWERAFNAMLTVNLNCCCRSSNAEEDDDDVDDNHVSETQIINSPELSQDYDINETKQYVDNVNRMAVDISSVDKNDEELASSTDSSNCGNPGESLDSESDSYQ